MKCPQCSERVFGLDCEGCGRTFEPRCPSCQGWFSAADRFCPTCGRDVTWVNYTNRVLLRYPHDLLPEDYEYPPERMGLKLLRNTGPLRDVTRLFIRRFSEPMFHGTLLGTSVRVTERQFPRIRKIAATCERILGLPPVNIFIGQPPPDGPLVTAFTYGTEESCCIFLTAMLVDSMTESELRFVIGHEMGHIKSHHVLYLTIANSIAHGLKAFARWGELLATIARQFILPWQRKAEVTGDRAGLICCQSLGTAIRTVVKISLGTRSLFAELDLEEYLRQGQTLREKYSWSEAQSGHPYIVNRVQLLSEFYHSVEFARVLQTAFDPRCPRVPCPRCRASSFFDDPARPIGGATCPRCKEALGIQTLPCPHCHSPIEVSAGQGLGGLTCMGCGRGYIEGLAPIKAPGEPESHYDVLGLNESASEADIDRAYVDRIRELRERTAPGEREVVGKLKLTGAYGMLSGRARRVAYDRRLRIKRALYRGREALGLTAPIESLPACDACGSPVTGKHCGQCGKAA